MFCYFQDDEGKEQKLSYAQMALRCKGRQSQHQSNDDSSPPPTPRLETPSLASKNVPNDQVQKTSDANTRIAEHFQEGHLNKKSFIGSTENCWDRAENDRRAREQ